MAFKVTKVISGNTFQVSPEWRMWNNPAGKRMGDTVQASGYRIPGKGNKSAFQKAKAKLLSLINEKVVELKNPVRMLPDRNKHMVVCDVYLNGKNLTEYLADFLQELNTPAPELHAPTPVTEDTTISEATPDDKNPGKEE